MGQSIGKRVSIQYVRREKLGVIYKLYDNIFGIVLISRSSKRTKRDQCRSKEDLEAVGVLEICI